LPPKTVTPSLQIFSYLVAPCGCLSCSAPIQGEPFAWRAALAAPTYIRTGVTPFEGPSCASRGGGLQGGWGHSLPRRSSAKGVAKVAGGCGAIPMKRHGGDLRDTEPQRRGFFTDSGRQANIQLHFVSGGVGDAVGMVEQPRAELIVFGRPLRLSIVRAAFMPA
jgi:hypothetical protein